jgi:hypothetical protein
LTLGFLLYSVLPLDHVSNDDKKQDTHIGYTEDDNRHQICFCMSSLPFCHVVIVIASLSIYLLRPLMCLQHSISSLISCQSWEQWQDNMCV